MACGRILVSVACYELRIYDPRVEIVIFKGTIERLKVEDGERIT